MFQPDRFACSVTIVALHAPIPLAAQFAPSLIFLIQYLGHVQQLALKQLSWTRQTYASHVLPNAQTAPLVLRIAKTAAWVIGSYSQTAHVCQRALPEVT